MSYEEFMAGIEQRDDWQDRLDAIAHEIRAILWWEGEL